MLLPWARASRRLQRAFNELLDPLNRIDLVPPRLKSDAACTSWNMEKTRFLVIGFGVLAVLMLLTCKLSKGPVGVAMGDGLTLDTGVRGLYRILRANGAEVSTLVPENVVEAGWNSKYVIARRHLTNGGGYWVVVRGSGVVLSDLDSEQFAVVRGTNSDIRDIVLREYR